MAGNAESVPGNGRPMVKPLSVTCHFGLREELFTTFGEMFFISRTNLVGKLNIAFIKIAVKFMR